MVDILDSVDKLTDLYRFNALHYEKLTGDKAGLESVRVNDQYCIEFISFEESEKSISCLTMPFNMNQKHWIGIRIKECDDEALVKELVKNSFEIVKAKYTKKDKNHVTKRNKGPLF